MQAPWREDQGGNVSRYVPHGQGLAQRGLLATSQVPGELSVAVRSCPMSLRLQVPPPMSTVRPQWSRGLQITQTHFPQKLPSVES